MASTSECSMPSEQNTVLIEQFCSVTGASNEKAAKMLEVCNWNLEMAVNMHVDSDFPENDCNSGDHLNNANTSAVDSEDVRPPIPPSRGVLVDEDPAYRYGLRGRKRRPHSIFDGFRDFQAEARWQEFASGAREETTDSTLKKRRTIEDLFRPPLDIMHRGSFESARDLGQSSNRWLMVNVQDSQEFSCQVLNRDVWSNPTVKSLVTQYFVFWQVYSDSGDGQRYMQFYTPVEFPYIAIIDPRTGENLMVWHKLDITNFNELVVTFLKEHYSPNGPISADNAISSTKYSLLDQSEEYQMKAALEASLKEAALVTVDDNDSDFETFDSDSESPNSTKASKVNSVHFNSDHSSDTIDVVTLPESNDQEESTEKHWKDYVGSENDPNSELVIRLPNGKREEITWPCSTKMKALLLYIGELGFDEEKYELVTNFPRRNLCQMDLSKTLKEIGLFPREMIFVQLKN